MPEKMNEMLYKLYISVHERYKEANNIILYTVMLSINEIVDEKKPMSFDEFNEQLKKSIVKGVEEFLEIAKEES
jgi:hypothetical protein